MTVKYCHICNKDQLGDGQTSSKALTDGIICPVCYQPTCTNHLATVRWRWRSSGERDAAQACKTCVRSYKHRDWDKYSRDWIS
ncbi:MAG: hypothetical protein GY805_22820 [Chloroflexi bacterium]|nr:hypothetical protein [Chloroflexota bacterium]